MREHEDAFEDSGARLAAIGLGDFDAAREFRTETGIKFPLIIDEDRKAYRAAGLRSGSLLHLLRRDNYLARNRARAAGHRQHGLGQHPFQFGGSLVLGPGDVDRFVHVSKTFGDHAAPGTLLDAVREAKAEIADADGS